MPELSPAERSGTVEASFIVIAHNEEPNIERTLRSIAAQRALDDYEIVVVDDASADDTVGVVRRYGTSNPAVRLISFPENRGRGFARASGVAASSGSFIATVDADIVLPEHWYERCREALRDADAVAGIAVPDGDATYVYRRFRLEPKVVHATTDVTGNNALYKREVFERANFDPELREGEDIAINHAMHEAGLTTRMLEDLTVRHEESKTFSTSVRWLYESGRGASRQLRRYRKVRLPDLVFAGWVGSVAMGTVLATRRRPLLGASLPAAYASAAAVAHLSQRFEFNPHATPRLAGAIAADAILLTAYFAGRATGLPVR